MRCVIAMIALAATALVGCSGAEEQTATTHGSTTSSTVALTTTTTTTLAPVYETPADVIAAAEAVGFECQSVFSVFESVDESDGQASCEVSAMESLYSVMTFTSERARLGAAIGGLLVGCTSEPVVYVYGNDWMALSFNEAAASANGMGDVYEFASALGGSVHEVNCAEMADTVLSIDPSSDPFDALAELTNAELRGVLGEDGATYSPPIRETTTTTEPAEDPGATLLTEPSAAAIVIPAAAGVWPPGTLIAGPDGSLWGSYQGRLEGLIFAIDPRGQVVEYGPFEVFPYLPNSMTVAPSGEVWFVSHDSEGAVWRLSNGVPERFAGADVPIEQPLSVIAATSDGSIWAATDDGDLVSYEGGNWTVFQSPSWLREDGFVRAISVTDDGTVWIGRSQSNAGGLIKYNGDWELIEGPQGNALRDIVDLAASPDGGVVALLDTDYVSDTAGRILHIDRDGTATPISGPAFDAPTSLTVQPNGTWTVMSQNSPLDVEIFSNDGESPSRRRVRTELSAWIGPEIASLDGDTWLLIGPSIVSEQSETGWVETLPEE